MYQLLGLFFKLFINYIPTIVKDSVNINLNLYEYDTLLAMYV